MAWMRPLLYYSLPVTCRKRHTLCLSRQVTVVLQETLLVHVVGTFEGKGLGTRVMRGGLTN